jgi:protein SCO1
MSDQNENDRRTQDDTESGKTCSTSGGCGPTFAGVPIIQLILVIFFIIMSVVAARGQVVQDNPPHVQKIDVIEHLGETIDLSLPLINSAGEIVPLGSQFADGLPVVLVFHYNDCPMLCSLVLNGLSNATRESDLIAGDDYRIVTISVDPQEAPDRSEASEARFNAELPDTHVGDAWQFFTADSTTLSILTNQVGFKYYFDAKREEFMHPAVVQILTSDGMISRYLYGIEYKTRDFRLGIIEGSEGKIGNTIDRILLYCMHYDPDAEGYVMVAGQVMKLGGALTLLILGFTLGTLWVKDRAKSRVTA